MFAQRFTVIQQDVVCLRELSTVLCRRFMLCIVLSRTFKIRVKERFFGRVLIKPVALEINSQILDQRKSEIL